MSNVILKMSAYSNITYANTYDTGISVEDWTVLSHNDQLAVMETAVWEDIEVTPVDEETGEYL